MYIQYIDLQFDFFFQLMDSLSLADDLISSLSMNDSTGEDFFLYNIPFEIHVCLHMIKDLPFTLERHGYSVTLEIHIRERSPTQDFFFFCLVKSLQFFR